MINRLSSFATLSLALLSSLTLACGDDATSTDADADAAVADPNAEPTAFRASKLTLLDPHVWALDGAVDVTTIVNDSIAEGVEQDMSDPTDDILDLSMSMVFQPLDQALASTPMAISFAECSAPLASTACTETAESTVLPSTATNDDTDSCLDAVADSTLPLQNTPVVPVPAPCFVSGVLDVTVPLGTITLPLRSAQISATYVGTPATSLTTGLLKGFVTTTDADAILIPEDVMLVGGDPLSSLLKDTDKDTGPNGEDGWWFYLEVEADKVDYTKP